MPMTSRDAQKSTCLIQQLRIDMTLKCDRLLACSPSIVARTDGSVNMAIRTTCSSLLCSMPLPDRGPWLADGTRGTVLSSMNTVVPLAALSGVNRKPRSKPLLWICEDWSLHQPSKTNGGCCPVRNGSHLLSMGKKANGLLPVCFVQPKYSESRGLSPHQSFGLKWRADAVSFE